MNSLSQDQTLLLGSRDSIEKLSLKEKSRILIFSDSHGAYNTLFTILNTFGESSDALIFCGDGMSDLTKCFEEALYEKKFSNCLPPVVAFVEGNNDTDMYPCANNKYKPDNGEPYYTQIKVPLNATLTASGHKIFITHGHRYALYDGLDFLLDAAHEEDADIVVFGHSHIAGSEIKYPHTLVINPGSCRLPRNLQPPAFALLTLEKERPAEDVTFFKLAGSGIKPFIPTEMPGYFF